MSHQVKNQLFNQLSRPANALKMSKNLAKQGIAARRQWPIFGQKKGAAGKPTALQTFNLHV